MIRYALLKNTTQLVLDIFPNRIPDSRPPAELAGALIAGWGREWTIHNRSLEQIVKSMTAGAATYRPEVTFPSGSWTLDYWRPTDGQHAGVFDLLEKTSPVGSFDPDSFFLPVSVNTDIPSQRRQKYGDHMWDATCIPVALGVLDALLPLAFETESLTAGLDIAPLKLAVAGACVALKPWREDTTYPNRGHNSRPFPLRTNARRCLEETLNRFFFPARYGAIARGWLETNLVEDSILVPNAPYNATHWVKGPAFETALSNMPAELVALGRALAPRLPLVEDLPREFLLEGKAEKGSAHDMMVLAEMLHGPAKFLRTNASKTWARSGPLHTTKLDLH